MVWAVGTCAFMVCFSVRSRGQPAPRKRSARPGPPSRPTSGGPGGRASQSLFDRLLKSSSLLIPNSSGYYSLVERPPSYLSFLIGSDG